MKMHVQIETVARTNKELAEKMRKTFALYKDVRGDAQSIHLELKKLDPELAKEWVHDVPIAYTK